MEYIAALMIGMAGSFHCAGMCGPIALSLSAGNAGSFSFLLRRLTYNFGRIVTYAILGLILGFVGDRLNLFGLQRWLSVFVGSVLILFVFIAYLKLRNPLTEKAYGLVSKFVGRSYSALKSRRSFFSMGAIGMLNGLLPCGFLYLGLGGAIALGNAWEGALYMTMFGLGTVPIMLGVTMFGNIITSKLRNRLTKLVPVMVLILGVLFILRGLNLGIPYLSPHESKTPQTSHEVLCK
jgi:hypothetical protein